MTSFIDSLGILFTFFWNQITNITDFLTSNIIGIVILSVILLDIIINIIIKIITMTTSQKGAK